MPSEILVSTESARLIRVAEGLGPLSDDIDIAGAVLLRQLLATPGSFCRKLKRGQQLDGLQVIARSREPLLSQPQLGDIVIRIVEGGAGHASVVATPGMVRLEDLGDRGLHPDSRSSQGYVHVVEPAPVARRANDGFARGLTDSAGRVLDDLVLLRLATSPTVITVPQVTTLDQSPAGATSVEGSASLAFPENLGDPQPHLADALDQCAAQTKSLHRSLSAADNPSRISRLAIAAETHVTVDANPYDGLDRGRLEAVIRAAFHSTQMPETLLALWAREGSLRMTTSATAVANASTADNARSLFRCGIYYRDFGSDHFLVTHYDPDLHDNVWDDSDEAAPKHEKHFRARVAELVKSGSLSEDIGAATTAELAVSASAPFSVTPSVKFYALSLLLMDALFTSRQQNTFPQIASLSTVLNYLQWNMGTTRFTEFLVSADRHRQEKAYTTASGDAMPLEQWALHTRVGSKEWRQSRINAIRFMHYQDSYRPIFAASMNSIRPATGASASPSPKAKSAETTSAVSDSESAPVRPKASACAYFFKGNRYLRYNIASDTVDFGPQPTSGFWPHLPAEFQSNLDSAINWGDGHAYFFKGARYLRYNIATDRVDVGPVEISRYWTNLPAEFQSDIKAAVNWGDGHAYFFKGSRYLRYNIANNTVDVGPVEIARNWTNLPAEFQNNLDTVVNWGDGHVYFFKGSRYLRYNIASDSADVEPTEIARNWTALPVEFRSDIGAAIDWTFPCDIAGLMRAAGLTVNEVGNWRTRKRPGSFTPIGVMMHHTAGSSSLGVVTNGRSDLSGPLANFHIEKSGLINLVSAGPANHAGRGAQVVLDEVKRGIAPTGTAAARGLPDSPGGNSFFYGFENENLGDGSDPWPDAQLDAMARAAAALCQLHCWNATRVIAHKEWTARKIDPNFDMNDFRARVAGFF